MNKLRLSLAALLLLNSSAMYAQNSEGNGVSFDTKLGWKEVREKAKLEGKYIFLDCFTTWCGPCKSMDKYVYGEKEIGEKMNRQFISIRVQMDSSKNDNPYVKEWYADAKKIMANCKIHAFPTLLFINPDGELVHMQIGFTSAKQFLAVTDDAVNPEKQYYTLLHKFKKHQLGYDQMASLATTAKNLDDEASAHEIARTYEDGYLFKQHTDSIMTRDNLTFIARMMNGTKEKDFIFFQEHTPEINAINNILETGWAEKKMLDGIISTEVQPKLDKIKEESGWDELETSCKRKYGRLGMIAVRESRMVHYGQKKEWAPFGRAYQLYYAVAGELSRYKVNDVSWVVFQNVDDQKVLASSVKIMEPHREENFYSMDTYANLLYKAGEKAEALGWEKKATALEREDAAKRNDKPDASYQLALEKMQKGEKTW